MNALLGLVLAVAPVPKETEADYRAAVIKTYGLESDAKDTPVRKLQKERCIERGVAVLRMKSVIDLGAYDGRYFGEYTKLWVTLTENLTELAEKPADKLKWAELRAEKLKTLEKFVAARVEAGNDPPQNLNIARANRIDADIEVMKLRGADTPEGLIKQSLGAMDALSEAIEKKEPADKIQAAAEKLKVVSEKLKLLKLGKDEDERLKTKYEGEMKATVERMVKAMISNPEAAKAAGDVLK